jgi:hypothetical protein
VVTVASGCCAGHQVGHAETLANNNGFETLIEIVPEPGANHGRSILVRPVSKPENVRETNEENALQ